MPKFFDCIQSKDFRMCLFFFLFNIFWEMYVESYILICIDKYRILLTSKNV